MANNRNTFLPEFPTDAFKRIFYPIRPLFTLSKSAVLVSLGWLGVLSMSWALWLAMISIDDLSLVPFLRLTQSIDNLRLGRKKAKSIISILAVLTGLALGAALSIFVLSQMTLFTGAISSLVSMMEASFMYTALCMVAGALTARYFGQDTLLGLGLGGMIPTLIPLQIPLFVESLFICSVGSAFLFTIASKQALRAYYYLRYGDTNADGYEINKPKHEIENEHQHIADHFNKKTSRTSHVSAKHVTEMLDICREGVRGVKKRAHIGNELTGSRLQLSCSFKDIYHGLKRVNNDNHQEINHLLAASHAVATQDRHHDTTGISQMHIESTTPQYSYIQGYQRHHVVYDRSRHTLFHQHGMEAAIHKLKKKPDQYADLHHRFASAARKLGS